MRGRGRATHESERRLRAKCSAGQGSNTLQRQLRQSWPRSVRNTRLRWKDAAPPRAAQASAVPPPGSAWAEVPQAWQNFENALLRASHTPQ